MKKKHPKKAKRPTGRPPKASTAGKSREVSGASIPLDPFEADAAEIHGAAVTNYKKARRRRVEMEKPRPDAILEARLLHLIPEHEEEPEELPRKRLSKAERKKAICEVGRHGMRRGYLGEGGKILEALAEGEAGLRRAFSLLEDGKGSGETIERAIDVIESFVERLRRLFSSAPEAYGDATTKLLRHRLTFPVNYAGKSSFTNSVIRMLSEQGFQKGFPKVPREMLEERGEMFRLFALYVFGRLKRWRSELEFYEPSTAFESRVSELPLIPSAAWRAVFFDFPEFIWGEEWVLDAPGLESYRQSFGKGLIPTNQARAREVHQNTREKDPTHRRRSLIRDAKKRLKRAAKDFM
jgi:hypothetical protein